jgi:predicted MPP superfamily phosphohydrolase
LTPKEVTVANTLTWLHLSDLHMRDDEGELSTMLDVLDALWADLSAQINELGGQLDFIAFTGDIAYSGKEKEYRLAEKHFFQPLLETTGLSSKELFVVPGNHDVDWDAIEAINPTIVESLNDRIQVNDFFKSDAKRRVLFSHMADYAQFVRRLFGECPDQQILRDPLYSYTQSIPRTYSVALTGLNSAWLSGFKRDATGKVTDRGNLVIGDKQIRDALKEAKEAKVRIALMHHPPSFLNEFDEHDTERLIRPSYDFVLRGHLHYPEFVKEKALGGETIYIPAGTVYQSLEWLNGYNLVQLNFDIGQGKIFLRRYSPERGEWIKDVQSTGDALDGVAEFDLPGALATQAPAQVDASSTSQILAKIKPFWLRLGRERETQLLESFLKQDNKDTLWIWGNKDCGLKEFLQIVQTFLQQEDADIIYLDAEDAAFGIAVDQHYFLDKLEHWAGIAPTTFSDWSAANTDQRLEHFLAGAQDRLVKSDCRLALVFANTHLLIPTIREWTWGVLWNQLLEPLKKYKISAIFACEGTFPVCLANRQENRIHLPEFTVQDVVRFLNTLPSVTPQEVPELARQIHSEGTDEFLASPRRVYQNLIAQADRLGLVSLEDTDADYSLDIVSSMLQATAQIIVLLEYDFPEFTPVERERFILALSHLVNVGPHRIHILQIAPGSVQVTLKMPKEGARRLISMYLAEEPTLRTLGIVKVAVQSTLLTRQEVEANTEWRAELRKVLTTRFNESELQNLCFDLQVDYESLPDVGKKNKARELVAYLERRNRFLDLIKTGRRLRPDVPWPDVIL